MRINFFGLNKYHGNVIAGAIFSGSLLSIMMLDIRGVIWFAVLVPIVAQFMTKLLRLKVNYEIAFGVGILTYLGLWGVFMLWWTFQNQAFDSLGTPFSFFLIMLILGVVIQLLTSLAYFRRHKN